VLEFGWEPGLKLMVDYTESETKEAQGDPTETFEERSQFTVDVSEHPEGLRISFGDFVAKTTSGNSEELRANYLRRIAITKATPSFVVSPEGRFLRVLDAEAALKRVRAALDAHPFPGAATVARGLTAGWVTTFCRQHWGSWVEGMLRKSPLEGTTKNRGGMPLAFGVATIPAEETTTVVGRTSCGDDQGRCVLIKVTMDPDPEAAARAINQNMRQSGGAARVSSWAQQRESLLEIDDRAMPRSLETKIVTTLVVSLPEGPTKWSRQTRRSTVTFVEQ
jgi:hypothetical protein